MFPVVAEHCVRWDQSLAMRWFNRLAPFCFHLNVNVAQQSLKEPNWDLRMQRARYAFGCESRNNPEFIFPTHLSLARLSPFNSCLIYHPFYLSSSLLPFPFPSGWLRLMVIISFWFSFTLNKPNSFLFGLWNYGREIATIFDLQVEKQSSFYF